MINSENLSTNRSVDVKSKNVQKRFTVFGVEFAYLYFFAIIVAFIGWLAENIARLITYGVIDSRFQMYPFIGVYGLIVFALHIFFGSADDITVFGKRIFKEKTKRTVIISNISVFVIISVFVFLGELAIGNLWGACFGVELWDYSKLPFSVTQYAGLIPSVGYGAIAYLIFKFAYAPILKLIRGKLNYKIAMIIDCTLGLLILTDTLRMCLTIIIAGQAPMFWSIKLW